MGGGGGTNFGGHRVCKQKSVTFRNFADLYRRTKDVSLSNLAPLLTGPCQKLKNRGGSSSAAREGFAATSFLGSSATRPPKLESKERVGEEAGNEVEFGIQEIAPNFAISENRTISCLSLLYC